MGNYPMIKIIWLPPSSNLSSKKTSARAAPHNSVSSSNFMVVQNV